MSVTAPIEVHSPTRVDLAGGTLDLWPLFSFLGGASTVNVAIDVCTSAILKPGDGPAIRWTSPDMKLDLTFKSLDEALKDADPKTSLIRLLLEHFKPEKGFHLETRSQSPVGGGLGGSSSLLITCLKAFSLFTGKANGDVHALVKLAHNLEARMLRTPTGTQDYYPAASGGLNILRYSDTGITQAVHKIDAAGFAERFLLVYTGRSHHSGLNNFEVLKGAVEGNPVVLGALHELKTIALETEKACLEGRWADLGGLFRREYESRVKLAPAFSCPEIVQLQALSLNAGADAVKICGAGGGGCVLVWCPPSLKERIADECRKGGFQVMNARPVDPH